MSNSTTDEKEPLALTSPTVKLSVSPRRPLILDYYFFTVEHEPYLKNTLNKLHLTCKICYREIMASIKITSNWITHLKTVHANEYQDYINKKMPKVKFKKIGMLMQSHHQQQPSDSLLIANSLNYEQKLNSHHSNETNTNAMTYDENDEENEEDIFEYEENDNEYLKNESSIWNESNNNSSINLKLVLLEVK